MSRPRHRHRDRRRRGIWTCPCWRADRGSTQHMSGWIRWRAWDHWTGMPTMNRWCGGQSDAHPAGRLLGRSSGYNKCDHSRLGWLLGLINGVDALGGRGGRGRRADEWVWSAGLFVVWFVFLIEAGFDGDLWASDLGSAFFGGWESSAFAFEASSGHWLLSWWHGSDACFVFGGEQ